MVSSIKPQVLKATRYVALVGAIAIAALLLMGQRARVALAEGLKDPLAILAQRSPGIRGAVALTKTKTTKPLTASTPDQDRVLTKVRFRPPTQAVAIGSPPRATEDGALVSNGSIVPPEFFGGLTDPPVPDGAGVFDGSHNSPGGGFQFSGVVSGGAGAGGGGGGAGAPPAVDPVVAAPVVVSIVPEPATWLMFIAGFWLLSATLRANRRTAAAGPHRPA